MTTPRAACLFPGCTTTSAIGHRGLCARCYARTMYHGTTDQFAMPRDPRGRKSGAMRLLNDAAILTDTVTAAVLDAIDHDEPAACDHAFFLRRIAAAKRERDAAIAEQRDAVMAALERSARAEEAFA